MARSSSSHRWLRFWAIGCGALVVILLGGALLLDDGVLRHERLDEEARRMKILNERLESENVRLRDEVEALKHNPEYVERVVRDELGWVKDDEVVFIVEQESRDR